MRTPFLLPAVDFKIREKNEYGDYTWTEQSSYDLFGSGTVLILGIPGAFTPTCSDKQVPEYDKLAEDFYDRDIDAIYVITVNDSFVANQWAKQLNLQNVEVIPDGSGEFTKQMNMLVAKDNLGMGNRSWRYAVIADNGRIQAEFVERGFEDNCHSDPYSETRPERILEWLDTYA
jgi:peroxiredoxin